MDFKQLQAECFITIIGCPKACLHFELRATFVVPNVERWYFTIVISTFWGYVMWCSAIEQRMEIVRFRHRKLNRRCNYRRWPFCGLNMECSYCSELATKMVWFDPVRLFSLCSSKNWIFESYCFYRACWLYKYLSKQSIKPV